jgi:hypothetical protein
MYPGLGLLQIIKYMFGKKLQCGSLWIKGGLKAGALTTLY